MRSETTNKAMSEAATNNRQPIGNAVLQDFIFDISIGFLKEAIDHWRRFSAHKFTIILTVATQNKPGPVAREKFNSAFSFPQLSQVGAGGDG